MKNCCHSNSSEKLSVNTDVKNSKGVNNNDNNKELSKENKNDNNNNNNNNNNNIWRIIETIPAAAQLKSVRILRRVLERKEDLWSFGLQRKPLFITSVKNSQRIE